jgi:hypothetical protein
MKRVFIISFILVAMFAPLNSASAIELYNWAFNIDGTIYLAPDVFSPPDPGQLPAGIDDTGFDWIEGTGMLSISYGTGTAGDCYIGAFFDHEMDEPINTFFNEYGDAVGAPAANQDWEIDEPGWVMGDIFYNFEDAALDNTNTIPASAPDDVSMALGWRFSLESYQTAVINFYVSELLPDNPFYLAHTDPDSDDTIYFYSDIEITGEAAPVPEPATMTLLGIGLLGLARFQRRKPAHRARALVAGHR